MNEGIGIGRCMQISRTSQWLFVARLLCLVTSEVNAQTKVGESNQRLILAHFMPWYEGDPASKTWGWHWTMNAFKPNEEVNGRRQIASHFYPIIGPYDSGDAHVLECQLLQMKLAGIDGVIVDWYGLKNFRDYALLHRNTQRLVEQVTRLEMQFAICYEDQTITTLVDWPVEGRSTHGARNG